LAAVQVQLNMGLLVPMVDRVVAEPGMEELDKAIYHRVQVPKIKATEAAIHNMSTEQILLTEALPEQVAEVQAVLVTILMIQILVLAAPVHNGLTVTTMLAVVVVDFEEVAEPMEV
jgi:hypothetical protein